MAQINMHVRPETGTQAVMSDVRSYPIRKYTHTRVRMEIYGQLSPDA